jgi:hypothetical protein
MAKKDDDDQDTFFIWWDEFSRTGMPSVCMKCGKKANWHAHRVESYQVDTAKRARRVKDTMVPFCEKHGARTAFTMAAGVSSKACTAQGIWVEDLSDKFIEAMKQHRKKAVAEWKSENEIDPKKVPNERLPPGLRREPELGDVGEMQRKDLTSNPMIWVGGGLIAVVLVVIGCGVCLMGGMMFFPIFMGMAVRR